MTEIRRGIMPYEKDFTMIPNAFLRDRRLSRKARGLLAELLSHSESWVSSFASLEAAGPEGREALRSAITELEKFGYLAAVTERDPETKKFEGVRYVTTDPRPVNGLPVSGFSVSGKSDTKKNKLKEDQSKEVKDTFDPPRSALGDKFDEFWKVYPKKAGKVAARKAFMAAVSLVQTPGVSGVSLADAAEIITSGARRYARSLDPEADPKYIKHPQGWLNAGRYDDEYVPYAPRTSTQPGLSRSLSLSERMRAAQSMKGPQNAAQELEGF